MKKIFLFLIAAVLALVNVSAMDSNDFLKANGKVLKNKSGSGTTVYLRGTNAGNIAVQEPWMCTTQATSNVKCERDIYNKLTQRFGADRAQTLLNAYRDNYFTTADFDRIASWGMNCIRLPLWYRDFEDDNGNWRSDAFTWLDWFVNEAGKRGIYVIIDMHGAQGSQNGRDHSGQAAGADSAWDEIWGSAFFFGPTAAANQERYYAMWERIAEHYKGNPAVAGYDILNEPFCTYRYSNYNIYDTQWNETNLHNLLYGIYNNAYKRIRAKDPDHVIIMEATWDPWDLPNPNDYGWTNVMYEYHQYNYGDYDNANGEQINGINGKVNSIKNQNYNVPSFIGEFCFFNKTATWETGLSIMNDNGLSWTSWSYKCIGDYGNWGLMNENSGKINLETASYDQILAKWQGLSSASWENTSLVNSVKKFTPGTVSSSGGQTTPTATIAAGEYYITAFEDNIVITDGTNPLIANGNGFGGTDNEIFIVEVNSDGTVSIKSKKNGKYVCAVVDENNQLTPRSNAASDWEKFELVPTGEANQYGIKAKANGKYVKADFGDNTNNGQLKASSDAVSGWEAFTFTAYKPQVVSVTIPEGDYYITNYESTVVTTDATSNTLMVNGESYTGAANEIYTVVVNDDGTVSFKAKSNGKYVCADKNVDYNLVARSETIGGWERFRLVPTGVEGQYGLLASINDLYVKGDLGNTTNPGIMVAASESVSGWEAFNIIAVPAPEEQPSVNEDVTGVTIPEGDYYITNYQSTVVTTDATSNTLMVNGESYTGASNEIYTVVVNDDNTVSFKAKSNGMYVCADKNVGYNLVARSESIGGWERFKLVPTGTSGQYGLLANVNLLYVKGDLGNEATPGIMVAASESVSGWEAFNIIPVPAQEQPVDTPLDAKFLKASGKVLKDNAGEGEVVYLRGTNAGNIAVQEPWMCTTQATSNVKCERDIYNILTQRFGADRAQTLLNAYRDNYFTTADFDRIASWGMNCIRLPLWYRDFEDANGNWRSDAFTWLDWFVSEAGKRGIYVIIDMHGAQGSQNGRDHSGQAAGADTTWDEINASEFFFGSNASANQERYYRMWERIAEHYKGNSAVAGYDILNEPYCTYRYSNHELNGTTWNETNLHNLLYGIYDNAYKRIRAKDPDHVIIMEATWDPWDLPKPEQYGWSNVMYEYHQYVYDDYDNANGKQISGINSKVNNINNQNHNVPSLMGEFCFFNQPSTWAKGLKIMNDNGINWTSWSYKCISDYGNWGLMNENSGKINLETASYDQILAKWQGLSSASWENTNLINTVKQYTSGYTPVETVTIPAGDYYLTAFENKIVTTDGTTPLAANGESFGGTNREIFTVEVNADGSISLKSKANNKYVCAVVDETDQLVARSASIGDWEKFGLVATDVADQYGILAKANGLYVKSDYNNTTINGQLVAASASISGWEAFKFTKVGSTDVPEVKTVNCPGSFSVADYSDKTETITITVGSERTNAGHLTAGSFLQYNVNVANAGKYDLNIELATSGAGRTLAVLIDGQKVGTYAPEQGPDFSTYKSYTVAMDLTAGNHTLRLEPSAGINVSNPSFTAHQESGSGETGDNGETDDNGTIVVPGGSGNSDLRVVGYLPDWESGYWNSIDYSALTHCVFCFLTYNADGSFGWWLDDTTMKNGVAKCKQNGVKTIIALGGGGGFNTAGNPFSTKEKRATIINKLKDFVTKYGLDGVDIDIEIGDNDPLWDYFDTFVQELRTALGNDKLLTMAVSEWFTSPISNSTLQRLDFLNVMTYDYAFGDGPVAPYDQCVGMMDRYAQRMGDAKRVTFGVPFYGYHGDAVTDHWRDIIAKNPANRDRDYDPDNGIWFNGVPTMKQKIEKSKDYGGIMIWQLGEDDFGSNSMLQLIKNNIGVSKDIVATNIPGKVSISNYAQASAGVSITSNSTATYAGGFNDGSSIDLYVNALTPGKYNLALALAAGDPQWNAKSVTVKLDDAAVATVNVTASTGWETFVGHAVNDMPIASAGVHKLTIVVNGGACNVSDFTVSKVPGSEYEFYNVIAIPGTIAIADYTEKSDKITINADGYAGDTGNGTFLTYYVNAAEAGEYTLTLPLAAGDAQWNAKSVTVKLDDQTAATVAVQASTGWTTFIDHTAKFDIAAGIHKLTFVVNDGAANIGNITLSKVAAQPEDNTTTSAKQVAAGDYLQVGNGTIALVSRNDATMKVFTIGGKLIASNVKTADVPAGAYVVITSNNTVTKVVVK